MNKTSYYLGVDGGGTGCRARLEDAAGNVLGRGTSGPATLRMGLAAAWQSISTAAAAALAEAGLDAGAAGDISAGFALAGLSRKGTGSQLAVLQHGYASVAFTTDAHGAFLGAHGGKDGAIVIVGTGSVGIGQVAGRELRVGGYGFPVSDEGSGAHMGLMTLQMALAAHDGRREKTPLLTEILQHFNSDPFEVVAWMDAATASDYATFAPWVIRHADEKDQAAMEILTLAAGQIDVYLRRLVELGAPRIALVGGLSGPISTWLSADVRALLTSPEGDAVSGAIILAKSLQT